MKLNNTNKTIFRLMMQKYLLALEPFQYSYQIELNGVDHTERGLTQSKQHGCMY